jgi:hypothetical protein
MCRLAVARKGVEIISGAMPMESPIAVNVLLFW